MSPISPAKSSTSSAKAQRSSTPTIIDARLAATALKALAATLGIWFAGMALLAIFIQPPVVAAFGPASAVLDDPSLKIVAMRPGVVLVAGEGRGWVRRLYANGAWFVWPIVGGGCSRLAARLARQPD